MSEPALRVYNPLIWLIVLLPLLSGIALIFWDLTGYLLTWSAYLSSPDPSQLRLPLIDAGYILLGLLSWVLYFSAAVLAFFDVRALGRAGVERPFHWAWVFLGFEVYVVGRSIVAFRRSGRGLAPIWALLGVIIVTIAIIATKIAIAVGAVLATHPTFGT